MKPMPVMPPSAFLSATPGPHAFAGLAHAAATRRRAGARARYAKVAHLETGPDGVDRPDQTHPCARHARRKTMSNIQLDIEWTEAASRKIEKLMPRGGNQDAFLALPPIECLPMEGDVLFLGPAGKQQPFIVAERQYHHEGDADWTIILILDVPSTAH
jgi:hypothetical protein